MKEYGVESSWQKLFRLAENFHENNYHYNLRPLCFTTQLRADQDDEIVFLNNKNELIRFEAKDRILERLIIFRSRIAQAIVYEESGFTLRMIDSLIYNTCMHLPKQKYKNHSTSSTLCINSNPIDLFVR